MADIQNSKSREKDRFVAFAFAAAETFLELNTAGDITFQSGIPFPARYVGKDYKPSSGTPFSSLVHPDDRDLLELTLQKLSKHGRIGPISLQIGGHEDHWMRVRMYGIQLPENKENYYISLRTAGASISVPKSDRNRDKETGLLDKEAFSNIAAQAMQSSDSAQVTMAKFDGLAAHKEKSTKEEHSSLLKKIATHLSALSVEGQVAAQVGEEEFAILNDAKTSQEEILSSVNAIPGAESIKAKTAKLDGKAGDMEDADIIRAVSHTLDTFKAKGITAITGDMKQAYEAAVEDTQNKIKDIREAIEKSTFKMAFQPIVDIKNGKLHHYEMLARPPENFKDMQIFDIIQFVESTNINEEFDFSILTTALDFIAKSHKMKDYVSLAINISGGSIQNEAFTERVLQRLSRHPRIEKWITLEVTESSRIMDLGAAARSIEAMRKKGFVVCLDDFGAGASGYQYLRELKVDYVKIDGIYVKEMLEKKDSLAFVKSMVGLCKDMEIKTIAEYVETPEQKAALAKMGVDYGQGWHFGKAEEKPSYDEKAFALDVSA